MIRGVYDGVEFSFDGEIISLGEYESAKAKGFIVWMGKTANGFIYSCYKEGAEPMVIKTSEAADMFRFAPPYEDIKDLRAIIQKADGVPENCKGLIALRAAELKRMGARPTYISEELKTMIESL